MAAPQRASQHCPPIQERVCNGSTAMSRLPVRRGLRVPHQRDGETGQGLAEYALILALIAIVAIVALIFLGGQISTILSHVGVSI
jgi:Flp pilus assembly pilin Flp